MKGHGTKFGRKKEAAIAALLTQRNVDEAARATDISTATLMRWQKLPEFQKAYRKARREVFGQAIAKLHQASGIAATTLIKLMVDTTAPPSVRLRAADSVLQHGADAIVLEDLTERVDDLEAGK